MHDKDTIIQEIHETRRRISEKFAGDVAAILEDARKRQEASGRPLWQRSLSDKTKERRAGESDRSDSE